MTCAAGRVTLLAAALIPGVGLAETGRWSVTATAQPARLATGESCQYAVTVTYPAGSDAPPTFEVAPPALTPGLVTAATRFQSRRRVGRSWELVSVWLLTADSPGAVTIAGPQVTARYADGAQEVRSGPPVRVEVTAGPLARARHGGSRLPRVLAWLAVPGLLLLAATALVRRRKPASAPPVGAEPVPAGLTEASERLSAGDVAGCFERLGHDLRAYVAGAAGVPCSALTSGEAAELLPRTGLPVATQQVLREALQAADEVTYARATWDPDAAWVLIRRLEAALSQTERDA